MRDFGVESIESPTHRLLRQEFAGLEARNLAAILGFNPAQVDATEEIERTTPFQEYETAEPQLTAMLFGGMLRRLDIWPAPMDDNDPDNIFQYQYENGTVEWLRMLTRADGVRIPVHVSLTADEESDSLYIENIRLLSTDRARELKRRLAEGFVDDRLGREFGLDESFMRVFELDFDDKEAMLDAHDELQGLEVAQPDQAELDAVRRNLVRAMLPVSKLWREVMGMEELSEATEKYERALWQFAQRYSLNGEQLEGLITGERLLRLSALKEQTARRHRAVKLGMIAMNASVTLACTGSGVLVGEMFIQTFTQIGEAWSGLAGGSVGFMGGIELWREVARKVRPKTRRVLDHTKLSRQPASPAEQLRCDLEQGRERAAHNLRMLPSVLDSSLVS